MKLSQRIVAVAIVLLLTSTAARAGIDITANQVGRLTSVGNSGTRTFTQYDAQGRVVATHVVQDGQSRVFSAKFGYPQNPAATTGPGTILVQETFADGEQVTYTYDLNGLHTTIRATFGGRANDILRDHRTNARGQVTRMDLGNGTSTTLTYDDAGHQRLIRSRTVNASAQVVQDYSYTYDGNGNLLTVTDAVRPDQSVTYAYDSLDQLISMSNASGSVIEAYSYDPIGNLTQKGAITQTYGAGGRPHALASSGGQTYGYDPNGNVTSIGASTTIQWNAENMPTRVTTGSIVADKSYIGETLWKKVEQGVTTYYLPSTRIENGAIRKYYGAYAERLEAPGDAQLRFYHPDHLGSSSVMTDQGGTVIRRVSYFPWGQDRGVEATFTPKLQFNFKEKDASGFYDYGARLYNPVTGRWLSPDNTLADGTNRYSYARNNPSSRVDPTGHTSDYIWIRYGHYISLWPANEPLPNGWWRVENNRRDRRGGYHLTFLDGKLSRLYPDGTMAYDDGKGRLTSVPARSVFGEFDENARAQMERISNPAPQVGADVEASLQIGEIFREFNHAKRFLIFMKLSIEGALQIRKFLAENADDIITLGIESAPAFNTNEMTVLGGLDATREYVSKHGGNRLEWGRWTPEVNKDYMYGVLNSARGEAIVLPDGGAITRWEQSVLEAARWKAFHTPEGIIYRRQPDSIIPPVLPKFPGQ